MLNQLLGRAIAEESLPELTLPFEHFEQEAVVSEPIYPNQAGRVYFQGSWWPARCEQAIALLAGETVYIVGRHNITLLVAPQV